MLKLKCNVTGLRTLTDEEIFKFRADPLVKEKLNGQLENYDARKVDRTGCVSFPCATIHEWDFMNKLSFYKIYAYVQNYKKPPVKVVDVVQPITDIQITPPKEEEIEVSTLDKFKQECTNTVDRKMIGTELLKWMKIDLILPGNIVEVVDSFLKQLLNVTKYNVEIIGVVGRMERLLRLLNDEAQPKVRIGLDRMEGDIVILEHCIIVTPEVRSLYRPTSQQGSRVLMSENYYNTKYKGNPNVEEKNRHPYLCVNNLENYFPYMEKHNIDKIAWVNSKNVSVKGKFDEGIIEDFNLLQQQFPKTVVNDAAPTTFVLWDGVTPIDTNRGIIYNVKYSHVLDNWYLGQILRGAGVMTKPDLLAIGFSKNMMKEFNGNALVVDSVCDLQAGIVYYIPEFQLSMVLPSLNLRASVQVVGKDLYKFTAGRLIYYANCDHGGNVFKHKHIVNVTPKLSNPEVIFSARRLINFPSLFRYDTGVKYWGKQQVDKVLNSKEYIRDQAWCAINGRIVWNPKMYQEDLDYIICHDGADFDKLIVRIAYSGLPKPKMEYKLRKALMEDGTVIDEKYQCVICQPASIEILNSRLEYLTQVVGWPIEIEIVCDSENLDVLTPRAAGFET